MTDDDGGAHPHSYRGQRPIRLDAAALRPLYRIQPLRAVAGLLIEWVWIVGVALACEWLGRGWWLVVAAVLIGARQHALGTIGHDGSHYRLLDNRRWNDLLSNVLAYWPLLSTVEDFRYVHSRHHQYLGRDADVQALAFGMVDAEGRLLDAWTYPKTPLAFVANLLFGLWPSAIARTSGALARRTESPAQHRARLLFLFGVSGVFVAAGLGVELLLYWFVPRMTWFLIVNDLRLLCQHSALRGEVDPHGMTRTTLAGPLERALVLPCNITYHIEHHWFPGVPWYNLPALHRLCMQHEEFRSHAHISHGLLAVLAEATDPRPVDFDQVRRSR